eukprot:TRINITY_DN10919_c0_g2_i1.p1 TRINITY_DN10919_c0_g2~~TRINITY_DN10919_c0_g2_i1.p1  ORF type:complete len:201 (+),score=17.23 TRINITY_DN10919_c0_g2_i1:1-603(+)
MMELYLDYMHFTGTIVPVAQKRKGKPVAYLDQDASAEANNVPMTLLVQLRTFENALKELNKLLEITLLPCQLYPKDVRISCRSGMSRLTSFLTRPKLTRESEVKSSWAKIYGKNIEEKSTLHQIWDQSCFRCRPDECIKELQRCEYKGESKVTLMESKVKGLRCEQTQKIALTSGNGRLLLWKADGTIETVTEKLRPSWF